MKWIATLFGFTLLIIAVSFRYYHQINGVEAAKFNTYKLKQLSIPCSPTYLPSNDELIPRLPGWGNYSWKITTASDSAQFYFDQGLNMYYAFHIIESRASFDKAIRFDSNCAIAWWGKALAFGPNINDFGYERPLEAYQSATKANKLKNNSNNLEKALIEAMVVRYSSDSSKDQNQLNVLYKDLMRKVYQMYSDNADASTLYADALLLLHPWDLYNHDYSPKNWTPEIISVIKNALRLRTNHPGANHYYIHAVEASANPQDALKSAEFLSTAMPGVSHITHMPSHIYIRTGYYNKGIEQNDKAIKGYEKYLQAFAPTKEGAMLYSLHNIHMKINCALMAGNYKQALAASNQLQKDIPDFYISIPGAFGNYAQYLQQSILFTRVRFGKWEEILNEKIVDSFTYTPVLQHFARGMALAKSHRSAEAEKELEMLKVNMRHPSLKEPLVPFNSAYDASVVAENILAGIIAEQSKDYENAISFLQKAILAEDNLIYNEPRDWLLPSRQYLGNLYLNLGKYKEALKVLDSDLSVNPNNGWDLTGTVKIFKKMNNHELYEKAQHRLKKAWLIKDIEIDAPVF